MSGNSPAAATPATQPTWQSAVIAVALMALVGGIFLVVFIKSGTDAALKVWGALGLFIGVLSGAIPTYFFQQRSAQAAQDNGIKAVGNARSDAQAAISAARSAEERARADADIARKQKDQADARYAFLAGVSAPDIVEKVTRDHPDPFAPMGLPATQS